MSANPKPTKVSTEVERILTKFVNDEIQFIADNPAEEVEIIHEYDAKFNKIFDDCTHSITQLIDKERTEANQQGYNKGIIDTKMAQ